MPLASKDNPATPAAAELAEEKGVDLTTVEGSGEGGKITKPDVEAVAGEAEQVIPDEDSPAAQTPSGYALREADGDPEKYAKARAYMRYGYDGS